MIPDLDWQNEQIAKTNEAIAKTNEAIAAEIKRSEEAILARVEDVRSKIDEKQVSLFSIFLLYPILVICHIPQ